jgi:hypothetical protein
MTILFPGDYVEELTKKDIEELEKKEKAGLIVDDVPGGVDVSIPIRVDYLKGDYHTAFALLQKNKIPIKYKKVQTVPPFHATIDVFPKDGVKAMKLLQKAGIKMYKVKPTF